MQFLEIDPEAGRQPIDNNPDGIAVRLPENGDFNGLSIY
jgi:hypothetical protein